MTNVVLFDTDLSHLNLLPLAFTRPLSMLRVGITPIEEKWTSVLGAPTFTYPVDSLKDKFLKLPDDTSDCIFVAGNCLPDPLALRFIEALSPREAVAEASFDTGSPDFDKVLAYRGSLEDFLSMRVARVSVCTSWRRVRHTFDIFRLNPDMIRDDFYRLTAGRRSKPLPDSCRRIGPALDEEGRPLIYIEEGARLDCANLNTEEGPIYIGNDACIMEGACVRGPLALCSGAIIRMGARIYGGCTFGPGCKVGGEVDNSVFFGFSNKAHDGYLGNAVIGEWCNIGAGVNASNLKNDYSKIRVWNYATRSFMRTDLQFCGLIMGDHSKVGINCMFNTATVVGVSVNIHGSGYPRAFIPSFSEGSPAAGFTDVSLDKFYTIAERVMPRRKILFTDVDRRIYESIYAVAQELKGR